MEAHRRRTEVLIKTNDNEKILKPQKTKRHSAWIHEVFGITQ
jgi:hypothetical protein